MTAAQVPARIRPPDALKILRKEGREKMKRIVLIGIVMAAVLFIAGCALESSYYISVGDTSTGFCYQVTTNNSDIKSALTSAGYVQGTCAGQGFADAHYCTYSAGSGSTMYEISVYWGTSLTPTDIQTACSGSGWTYH